MKATAVAPANIAFIKYWGKEDDALRLPLNDSLSMNLSGAYTTTTVEFSSEYSKDSVNFLPDILDKNPLKRKNVKTSEEEKTRICKHLDRIREYANITTRAHVVTQNSFPKGAGAASSASGFAALTVAGFAAAGVKLSEKELTIFARLGSGSASRSIPDGFVIWEKAHSSDTSYAYSLYPHSYWDIRDILVVVDSGMKKISTSEGHEGIKTSPHWQVRIAAIPRRMKSIMRALKEKDFKLLGEIIEEDCRDCHHVMQTQVPPLYYWNDSTKAVMDAIKIWRHEGLPVYFTIDAGPNVHVLCEAKDEELVVQKIQTIGGVQDIIRNKSARGAHLVEDHLY